MANKILVVDDEKLIVKGIRYSLEQDGMAVEVAYDGRQALEMAQNNAYDVILLDVMLPGWMVTISWSTYASVGPCDLYNSKARGEGQGQGPAAGSG